MPTCTIPPYPDNIEPRFLKQEDGSYVVTKDELTLLPDGKRAVKWEDLEPLADGSYVVSGDDLVLVMMWIEQLAVREKAEADCIDAGRR